MAVNKIDPKVIFASEAPAQDTPAVFTNRTVGWGETRKNGGRPTIKQMNAEQQSTDLKILWLNENAVTPYDPTIDYPLDAVTIKDGIFKIFNGSVWEVFLDKTDIGLGNVDNTSDLNKPISTTTQTALDLKADKVFVDNALSLQQEINDRGGATWYSKSGGYNLNDRVILGNGDIVQSNIANNTVDPNVNMANWVFSSSGLNRTQKDINNDWVNVRNYGAVGDSTLHTVEEWTVVGSSIYYPDLAAIQVDYPFVSSLSDSVDWAGIQRALNTGKHVLGPFGNYKLGGESLFYKTDGQQVLNLGSVNIDASLGKPCIHIGASDKAGTPKLTWRGRFNGTDFYGTGTRAVGSAGVNLVSCSQIEFNFRATGFHEGMSITGACYANTFNTLTLVQNTYGIGDRTSIADLQGSVFLGGRIEQNKLEGVKFASVNTKFIGTVIEGNGLWDGGDGSTPEVTILGSSASGAVTFDACYMESLNGKSAGGIIGISPLANRYVFINGGEYFGGVTNKTTIVVVDIKANTSASMGVNISGAYVSDVKNYARGVISGDSRVSVVNCMPKEPLTVWTDVTVGTGLPLIQQFDREYWYTNQNIRVKQVTATGPITGSSLVVTDTATCKYTISTDANIGRTEFNNYFQSRQLIQMVVSASPIVAQASEIPTGLNYLLEVKAIGRAGSSNSHVFKASLLINNPSGTPTIAWQSIDSNSKAGQTLNFSFDGSNNLIVNSSAGDSLNGYLYRFFKNRYMQS